MLNSRHLLQGPSGADRRPGATPGEAGHESHGGPEPVPRAHLRGGRNRSAAREAAVVPAQSPGSCFWKRKGWETHLSESRAAAFLPANRAGPWGVDSPGRGGKSGPGRAPGFSSPSAAAAPISLLFWFSHTRRWESHMSLFTGRGSCPAARFCSSAPPPLPPRIHTHTHTNIWCLGGSAHAGALASLNPGSSAWGYSQRGWGGR